MKVMLVAFAMSFCLLGASAKSTHEQQSTCIPPFPMLNPLDQREYEKMLSQNEVKWIHATALHLDEYVKSHATDLKNVRCCFYVDNDGRIKQPISFAQDLSEMRKRKLEKDLANASPLPKPVTSLKDKPIFVEFDLDSTTTIRFGQ
jgi:hypothetical protein